MSVEDSLSFQPPHTHHRLHHAPHHRHHHFYTYFRIFLLDFLHLGILRFSPQIPSLSHQPNAARKLHGLSLARRQGGEEEEREGGAMVLPMGGEEEDEFAWD